MPKQAKEPKGCGCGSIPISLIILILGGGYWLFTQRENLAQFLPSDLKANIPFLNSPAPEGSVAMPSTPTPVLTPSTDQSSPPTPVLTPSIAQSSPPTPTPLPQTTPAQPLPSPQTAWEKKVIRGIYISRYKITNNASEQAIRESVRHYHSQGFNTIIHGVWGNACTMYNSEVMQKTLGYKSCPNEFQDQWLDWLIDEAHKQGMQVHAYFEKGIKIDEKSPIFDLAVERGWIVAGVDRTHPGVDHYVLNVEIPEVANFFTNVLVEFVQKYPKIDAVQWDDYLGYYAELPGKVDRTAKLTTFVQNAIAAMKKANPAVSFDLCHHNPYWAKQYFAADWQNWNVDRVFIQVYNEKNFKEEMKYIQAVDGIAISERQLNQLDTLANNPQVKSILIFPLSGKPEVLASEVNKLMTQKN